MKVSINTGKHTIIKESRPEVFIDAVSIKFTHEGRIFSLEISEDNKLIVWEMSSDSEVIGFWPLDKQD